MAEKLQGKQLTEKNIDTLMKIMDIGCRIRATTAS